MRVVRLQFAQIAATLIVHPILSVSASGNRRQLDMRKHANFCFATYIACNHCALLYCTVSSGGPVVVMMLSALAEIEEEAGENAYRWLVLTQRLDLSS